MNAGIRGRRMPSRPGLPHGPSINLEHAWLISRSAFQDKRRAQQPMIDRAQISRGLSPGQIPNQLVNGGRDGGYVGRLPGFAPGRSCCGVYVLHYGAPPEVVHFGECAREFELLDLHSPLRDIQIERGARITWKQRPVLQDVPAPARRVGRVAGASHQRHSPSSRTSLAPGERTARPAVGPRPGSAPRRGGSDAGQRRTRHRHEPTPAGDGAGIVSQERPHLHGTVTP